MSQNSELALPERTRGAAKGPPDYAAGMRIGGYEVERELARGGMGVVYLAHDPRGRRVAIKVILAADLSDPESLARFRREAEALALLDHPGILRVHDHGVEDGRPYTVIEYLAGPTLAERVETEGPLPEAEVTRIGARLADALAHAHARGVLHRDLKPGNVILDDGEPVLVDFGLALSLGFDRSRLTETGTILGSVDFMAPEQARGEKDLGNQVDVYGLGATLYTLLSGAPPFSGATALRVLERVVGEPPPPLRASHGLAAIVLRCLEKDPEQRFADAAAVAEALREVSLGGARRARSPWVWRVGAAAGLALVAALGLSLARGDDRARYRALVSSAQDRHEAGEYEQALTELDLALTLEPRLPAAYLVGAQSLAELGRVAEALEHCKLALELDAQNTEAYLARAGILARSERYEAASLDYTRALELDPALERALLGRAQCSAYLGRLDSVVRDCSRALEFDPTLAEALEQRAFAFKELGQIQESVADATRALELDPSRPRSWAIRGQCRSHLGDLEQALSDFEQAVRLGPQDGEPLVGRGIVQGKLGRSARALEDLTLAIELLPQEDARAFAYGARGHLQGKLGLLDAGVEDLSRAIELAPEEAGHRVSRGELLLQLDRAEEALDDYERAFELGARGAYYRLGRGLCLVKLKRDLEAIAEFDRALELELEHRAYGYRGFAKARLRRYAEAIEDLDRALALAPGFELYQDWRQAALKESRR